MKWKDEGRWRRYKTANDDDYGSAILEFAERWADGIEGCLEGGHKGEKFTFDQAVEHGCVIGTLHEADVDCTVNDWQQGDAVHMLGQCWAHGEDLQRWYKDHKAQAEHRLQR